MRSASVELWFGVDVRNWHLIPDVNPYFSKNWFVSFSWLCFEMSVMKMK